MKQLSSLDYRFLVPCGLAAFATVIAGCKSHAPIRPLNVQLDKWVEDDFSGRRMITGNYEIYSTLTDVDFERRLPEVFEAAYRRFSETMPPTSQSRKMQVYIFATRQQWEQFTRARYPARWTIYSRIRSGGFTEGDAAIIFYHSRAQTLATLIHEGWHQYAHSRIAAPVPAWLNEGLACYFEGVELREAGELLFFTPTRNPYRLNPLRRALHSGQLFSIEELVSTNAGEVIHHGNSGITQTYYAQVWALVVYLLHGEGSEPADSFMHLLADIASGEFNIRKSAARFDPQALSGSSVEPTFIYYFGVTPGEMNPKYLSYLQKLAGYNDTRPRTLLANERP